MIFSEDNQKDCHRRPKFKISECYPPNNKIARNLPDQFYLSLSLQVPLLSNFTKAVVTNFGLFKCVRKKYGW